MRTLHPETREVTNAWAHTELLGFFEDEEGDLAEQARAHADAARRASLGTGREPAQLPPHAGFCLLVDGGLFGCGLLSRRLRFSVSGAQRAALLLALHTAAATRLARVGVQPLPAAPPAAPPTAAVRVDGRQRGEAGRADGVEAEPERVERAATSWSWGQGQRDTGMSCGQGMDRLGCLLCSSSTSSLNSTSISVEGLPAFVPTALHAQQQEHLAVMRESLIKLRTHVGSRSSD